MLLRLTWPQQHWLILGVTRLLVAGPQLFPDPYTLFLDSGIGEAGKEEGLGLLKQNAEWGMPGGDGGSMSPILCDPQLVTDPLCASISLSGTSLLPLQRPGTEQAPLILPQTEGHLATNWLVLAVKTESILGCWRGLGKGTRWCALPQLWGLASRLGVRWAVCST